MKLKEFRKILKKIQKECGDVDIEFWTDEEVLLELKEIGHFGFIKDVTVTFTQAGTSSSSGD